MEALETLLGHYGKRRAARWWIGARPEGRERQLPRLIAAKVGYPTGARDPFAGPGLVRLSLEQAAHVLAVAATTSLAYGSATPKVRPKQEMAEALRGLEGSASFFGNGLWQGGGSGWTPLSSATFDCGVIGYDADTAFIFWVEEED